MDQEESKKNQKFSEALGISDERLKDLQDYVTENIILKPCDDLAGFCKDCYDNYIREEAILLIQFTGQAEQFIHKNPLAVMVMCERAKK